MNCNEARTALEAEPSGREAALLAHLHGCPACVAYRAQWLELDDRIRAALTIPVPESPRLSPAAAADRAEAASVVPLRPRAAARRPFPRLPLARLALAASVGGVAVITGLLWLGFPRASLADDVVAHMAHEPTAWTSTRPVAAKRLAEILERGAVALRPAALDVTYAQSCWFRGRRVPHLVVQSGSGPVTVMVLTHEDVGTREPFEEGGYRGVLVPAPRGSLAVLARDAGDVDAAATRALAALQY